MGVNKSTDLSPYGDYWRSHRRLWANYFGQSSISDYHELITSEAKALALRLVNTRKDTFTELRLFARFTFQNIATSYAPRS